MMMMEPMRKKKTKLKAMQLVEQAMVESVAMVVAVSVVAMVAPALPLPPLLQLLLLSIHVFYCCSQ